MMEAGYQNEQTDEGESRDNGDSGAADAHRLSRLLFSRSSDICENMLKDKRQADDGRVASRLDVEGALGTSGNVDGLSSAMSGEGADGAGPAAVVDLPDDDFAEWDDYVPEGIFISEERRQELRREQERYLADLIEEVGEPTAEEMARAEAWWRPIEQHLMKGTTE